MARGINLFIGIGNLGADPEQRFIPSGAGVTSFNIAISESWTDKSTGEIKERTEWVSCEVWGKLGEVCAQYLRKGSKVYVSGKLQTETWEQEGVKKYRTKVRVDECNFLDPKPADGAQRAPAQRAPAPQQKSADFDSDIPF